MRNSVSNSRFFIRNRFLFLISAVLFLPFLISCSVSFKGGNRTSISENTPVIQSWFQNDTSAMLFTTSVDLMKKHYSGIMVVKGTGTDTFRVVMITEVGLKIFDFGFIPVQDVVVHYIMDPLNKRILIKTLSNDLRLILMNDLDSNKPVILVDKKSGDEVLKYRVNGKKAYYYKKLADPKPYQVIQTGCITNKVKGSMYGVSRIDSLKISHYNFKLAIQLHRIKEEPYVAE